MSDQNDLSKVDLDAKDDVKPEHIAKAYRTRLTTLKRAQDYTRQGDIPKAVEGYSQYLNVLAAYLNVDEKDLTPTLFDSEKDLTELLLISNSYWELAKAYDRSPNLHNESIRCLKQFIEFTIGFKFQHVNAQMVKKFVRSKKAHNLAAFKQASEKIRVETKGCFIATYSYGEYHPITESLRGWRDIISKYPMGQTFIKKYYEHSPTLVRAFERFPIIGTPLKILIIRPFLWIWVKFLRLFFIK